MGPGRLPSPANPEKGLHGRCSEQTTDGSPPSGSHRGHARFRLAFLHPSCKFTPASRFACTVPRSSFTPQPSHGPCPCRDPWPRSNRATQCVCGLPFSRATLSGWRTGTATWASASLPPPPPGNPPGQRQGVVLYGQSCLRAAYPRFAVICAGLLGHLNAAFEASDQQRRMERRREGWGLA